MSSREYSDQERAILLEVARRSIAYGLDTGRPLPVNVAEFPPHLQEERASFVTLNENGRLRGCIGALEAYQPLVKDVADHAFAAAFRRTSCRCWRSMSRCLGRPSRCGSATRPTCSRNCGPVSMA